MSRGHLLICTAHLKFIYDPSRAHVSLPIIWDEIGNQLGERARGNFHVCIMSQTINYLFTLQITYFSFQVVDMEEA